MQFDIPMTDELLATTRAVRKRLDLERPVPKEIIMECLELAVQAPTGSNAQGWRWLVIDDPALRARIAECYRKGAADYLTTAREAAQGKGDAQNARVFDSAVWLAENLEKVPVFVIPCIQGHLPENAPQAAQASLYGSIFPAVWSFQLALRARGLGSTLTTLHLMHGGEVVELLGIPDGVIQAALLPVAYTRGTDFKRAKRPPVEGVTHWNGWHE